MPSIARTVETYLPLKADTLQILLALEGSERHGYAILKEIERATEGALRLAPSLDDERRRYYRLTDLGREVLSAEAMRLVELAGEDRIQRLAQSRARQAEG
jgi:DNA-binding PadR family transcriptional regulator